MSVKSIKIETVGNRIFLAAVLVFVLFTAFLFVKWCIGDMLAARPVFIEIAELAAQLSPDNPQPHFALGVLYEEPFLPEDFQKSLAEYEKAAALAPYDYRTWLALGKSRERNGDADGGRLAAEKALQLAPNYALVQWTLGNILLRQNKTAEAFAQIRQAAENDETYRTPLITTAWQIADGNLTAAKQYVGTSPAANSALALFLVRDKKFDEALEIWNALPADAKRDALQKDGEEFSNQLTAAKRYRDALAIRNASTAPDAEQIAIGKIFNGDFELPINPANTAAFDWQIADGREPQIGVDTKQKHGGNQSLTIVFDSATGKDFRAVSQIVAIEPATGYVFEFFYKSELKTAAPLVWEIADATDGKILATVKTVAANPAWTNLKTEFVTGADSQAVVVRLGRENCTSAVCPISGKIWFDDFAITR